MEWAQQYLGQRGLATKYFVEEVDPKVDPLSPENKMIMATGPLTGTMASTGGRYSVITKGPLTGAIACSNSGGYFGAELKMAGWDMIIFEGKSPKPVYLSIEDDKAELRDAAHLWGKTVWETEEIIKKSHQDPQVRVSSIGRAGENGVLYACVVNDLHRAAGRSGVGTVMGSKNLKAVAVRGTKGVGGIKDFKAFMKPRPRRQEGPRRQRRHRPGPAQVRHPGADERDQRNGRAAHAQPPRRAVRRRAQDLGRSHAREAPHRRQGQPGHQPGLLRLHHRLRPHFAGWTRATSACETSPKYWGATGGLEYEAAWALGAANGVNDLDALQYANMICNEDGMDPITFGATVGAVMELYEMGVLTKEQIGIESPFGSAQALAKFADMTAKGEGFGKEIGLGSAPDAKYGHPELSMTVKGQEFPAYDRAASRAWAWPTPPQPRRLPPARLHRGVRSARHPGQDRPAGDRRQARAGEGLPGRHRRLRLVRHLRVHHLRLGPGRPAPQVDAACDRRAGHMENWPKIGERIWNMERDFNNAAGFTAKDDDLPQAPADRAGQDRPGQGPGQQAARDAAQVLRRTRLGRRAPQRSSSSGRHAERLGSVTP
jgi:aldehyde:ferredoxin oxidoreductase